MEWCWERDSDGDESSAWDIRSRDTLGLGAVVRFTEPAPGGDAPIVSSDGW